MGVQRIIHRFLIAFGIVVTSSFGYGGYLMFGRRAPTDQPTAVVSSDGSVDDVLRTATKNLNEKHAEQALVGFRKALTMAPNSVEAQTGVARGELMAGRESVAAQEYERVLKLSPDSAPALLQLARIYGHQHETWSLAETKYTDLLRLKRDDSTAQLELARVLAWERKSKDAADLFSKPSVQSLMSMQDHKDYAFALVRAGRANEAEPVLKKIVAARPTDSEVQLQLASIYAARRDWSSALPLYETLLRQSPDDARLNLTYGSGLLSAKRYQAAVMPLAKARKSMPNSIDAGLAYARALKGAGDLKHAAQEFDRVADSSADSALLREYADLLLEKRDYRGAEKFYKRAHALGLRDTRLLLGLAGALRGNGKNKEAIPYLEQAYEREPNDRVGFELAVALQKTGHRKEALMVLAKIDKTAH
jgi:tetratricopeptide (TPR) repeat protein